MRSSERERQANRNVKSSLATARRAFLEAVAGGDGEAARKAFEDYASRLDKAAKGGVIHSNNAGRHKARAAKRLAALGSASQVA